MQQGPSITIKILPKQPPAAQPTTPQPTGDTPANTSTVPDTTQAPADTSATQTQPSPTVAPKEVNIFTAINIMDTLASSQAGEESDGVLERDEYKAFLEAYDAQKEDIQKELTEAQQEELEVAQDFFEAYFKNEENAQFAYYDTNGDQVIDEHDDLVIEYDEASDSFSEQVAENPTLKTPTEIDKGWQLEVDSAEAEKYDGLVPWAKAEAILNDCPKEYVDQFWAQFNTEDVTVLWDKNAITNILSGHLLKPVTTEDGKTYYDMPSIKALAEEASKRYNIPMLATPQGDKNPEEELDVPTGADGDPSVAPEDQSETAQYPLDDDKRKEHIDNLEATGASLESKTAALEALALENPQNIDLVRQYITPEIINSAFSKSDKDVDLATNLIKAGVDITGAITPASEGAEPALSKKALNESLQKVAPDWQNLDPEAQKAATDLIVAASEKQYLATTTDLSGINLVIEDGTKLADLLSSVTLHGEGTSNLINLLKTGVGIEGINSGECDRALCAKLLDSDSDLTGVRISPEYLNEQMSKEETAHDFVLDILGKGLDLSNVTIPADIVSDIIAAGSTKELNSLLRSNSTIDTNQYKGILQSLIEKGQDLSAYDIPQDVYDSYFAQNPETGEIYAEPELIDIVNAGAKLDKLAVDALTYIYLSDQDSSASDGSKLKPELKPAIATELLDRVDNFPELGPTNYLATLINGGISFENVTVSDKNKAVYQAAIAELISYDPAVDTSLTKEEVEELNTKVKNSVIHLINAGVPANSIASDKLIELYNNDNSNGGPKLKNKPALASILSDRINTAEDMAAYAMSLVNNKVQIDLSVIKDVTKVALVNNYSNLQTPEDKLNYISSFIGLDFTSSQQFINDAPVLFDKALENKDLAKGYLKALVTAGAAIPDGIETKLNGITLPSVFISAYTNGEFAKFEELVNNGANCDYISNADSQKMFSEIMQESDPAIRSEKLAFLVNNAYFASLGEYNIEQFKDMTLPAALIINNNVFTDAPLVAQRLSDFANSGITINWEPAFTDKQINNLVKKQDVSQYNMTSEEYTNMVLASLEQANFPMSRLAQFYADNPTALYSGVKLPNELASIMVEYNADTSTYNQDKLFGLINQGINISPEIMSTWFGNDLAPFQQILANENSKVDFTGFQPNLTNLAALGENQMDFVNKLIDAGCDLSKANLPADLLASIYTQAKDKDTAIRYLKAGISLANSGISKETMVSYYQEAANSYILPQDAEKYASFMKIATKYIQDNFSYDPETNAVVALFGGSEFKANHEDYKDFQKDFKALLDGTITDIPESMKDFNITDFVYAYREMYGPTEKKYLDKFVNFMVKYKSALIAQQNQQIA